MASDDGRIDVHCHSMTPAYRAAIANLGAIIRTPDWSPQLALEFQDRHGIAAGIYSLSVPGTHHGDDAKARTLARRVNEESAEFIAKNSKRFGAYATLPVPDMDGACEEAINALDVMKLDGVGLLASYDGVYLGQPNFNSLFEILNRHSAVVLIHPNNHPTTVEVKKGISPGIGNFLIEFLFDTTRSALNLMFTGALDRFPKIRFILAHAGGTLPYTAWRLADIVCRQMTEPPWDTQYPSPFMQRYAGKVTPELVFSQLRRFWYETALAAGPSTLGSLKAVADPAQIVFGSDWPYCPTEMAGDMIAALGDETMLDAKERAAIEQKNALALFPRFA
jgi:predicted TIM-barrel fold metal-dependent hydrolase